ncbi:MAG: hypothetical protein QM820_49740 [Minicystis sp.]
MLSLALLTAPTGCVIVSSHDSTNVSTLDINMDVDAADDGKATTVKVHLGSPIGDVHLAGGDHLRLTAAGIDRPLTEARDGDDINYTSTFGDASGTFELDLIRPDDRNALDITFRMPPSFALDAPDLSAADPISLTWDPGDGVDDTLDLAISGPCVQTLARTLAQDTGSYSINPAELVPAGGGGRCPLTITMRRASTEQRKVIEGLDSGWFQAKAVQTRTIEIQWSP